MIANCSNLNAFEECLILKPRNLSKLNEKVSIFDSDAVINVEYHLGDDKTNVINRTIDEFYNYKKILLLNLDGKIYNSEFIEEILINEHLSDINSILGIITSSNKRPDIIIFSNFDSIKNNHFDKSTGELEIKKLLHQLSIELNIPIILFKQKSQLENENT